ncbi:MULTISPECIES: MAE_28990/MAE_18760 family HEPN-like nuclease [Shewanella]|uniref:MAE_28990/MAE_18760 family HEPN-like nuclease n=1 Tax=Shewanella TaxID=22 RepID=UPI000D3BD2BB|nr:MULTISPECIES: MAE_28990/MAE_18760 family HEPN-like nuclease [Shewanella]MCI2964868.1 MAE_28990/MAE_18760 family HEPN-like nuclease [Shewanella sp. N2AIL]
MQPSKNSDLYLQYTGLYLSLRNVINSSNARVIANEPDQLFIDNVNFFVKSYLISICSYLEAYLQDIAFKHSVNISNRLSSVGIPHNFVHWRLNTGLKDKYFNYENLSLDVTKKDISDNISANPYRTLKLFQFLGIDLSRKDDFEKYKHIINTIVTKRNNIVHHNDRAADISFSDLLVYIDVVIPYMNAVKEAVDEVTQ